MKFDKNKMINSILGIALVGTTTVAIAKIDRVSNSEKVESLEDKLNEYNNDKSRTN